MLVLIVALVIATLPRVVAARDVELLALTPANTLLRFNAGHPGQVATMPVTGISGTLIGIDVRPANQKLYGVSGANDIYTIDVATGAAVLVSTLTVAFDGGPRSGVDFNPQADRLRLVGGNGQNLRVNVDLGAAATDAPLAYAATDRNAGKRPAIAGAAYTNAVAGAATTKLFDLDSDLDVLALQDPPNDGILVTVGPLNVDFGSHAGLDIVSRDGGDSAFAVSAGTLYTIDLATGGATAIGAIGGASGDLVGVAAVPESGH